MASKFQKLAPVLMDKLISSVSFGVLEAAAAVGNFGHESNGMKTLQEIAPTVKNSRGGYGWPQWTGARRRAYEAFCKSSGVLPSSDDANIAYIIVELKSTEKAAVRATKAAGNDPGLPELARLTDKVVAFESHYERAGVKHYPSRVAYAKQALAAYRALHPAA